MKTARRYQRTRACVPLLIVVFGAACGDNNDPGAVSAKKETELRIQTEVARAQPLSDQVLTSAQIEAATWQSLYFGSGGTVTRVLVEENARVTRGQLLAEVDTQSQINQVEKSQLSLKKTEMDEEQARHDLENTKALLETGGASDEQVFDQEQRLEEAIIKTKQSRLSLDSQEIRLEQMRLRAPFEGMLTEVNIRVGDQVRGDVSDPDRDMNMRPPMVVIDPKSSRTFRALIPEGRARQVEKGTPATITLMENRDITLQGEVEWVGETVDRETRTVVVKVSVKRPEEGYPDALRDGSTALVTLLPGARSDAITITEDALYYYRDQAYVFVVNGSSVLEKRPITLGLLQGGRVEVVNGLAAGERVARSHLYLLRDGQKVLTEGTP